MKWLGHGYCIILISISRSTSFIDHFLPWSIIIHHIHLKHGGLTLEVLRQKMQLPVWVGHLDQQEPWTQRQTNPSSRETKNMQPETFFFFQTFFPSFLINSVNLNIPLFLDHSIHSEHWIQVACQILMLWPLLQWQWHSWDAWSRRRNSWSVWCSASQELEMGMLRMLRVVDIGSNLCDKICGGHYIDNNANGGYFRSKRGPWKRNFDIDFMSNVWFDRMPILC